MGIKLYKNTNLTTSRNPITITHNLASYPLIQILSFDANSYGTGLYGFAGYGDNYVENFDYKVSYVNNNELQIFLPLKFKNPTNLTMVNANEYELTCDNSITLRIYLK